MRAALTKKNLALALLVLTADTDLVHDAYRGLATADADLLGGHVQPLFTGISGLAPSVKERKLPREPATSSSAPVGRSPALDQRGVCCLKNASTFGLTASSAAPVFHSTMASLFGRSFAISSEIGYGCASSLP